MAFVLWGTNYIVRREAGGAAQNKVVSKRQQQECKLNVLSVAREINREREVVGGLKARRQLQGGRPRQAGRQAGQGAVIKKENDDAKRCSCIVSRL